MLVFRLVHPHYSCRTMKKTCCLASYKAACIAMCWVLQLRTSSYSLQFWYVRDHRHVTLTKYKMKISAEMTKMDARTAPRTVASGWRMGGTSSWEREHDTATTRRPNMDGRTEPRTAVMDTFHWGSGGNDVMRMGTQQQEEDQIAERLS